MGTGALNRELARATERFPPKAARGGAPVKVLYATQVGISPPTIVISLSHPVDLHFSYKRYLENAIRREYGFDGVPLRLSFRARGGDS